MSEVLHKQVEADLVRDEGVRNRPYTDTVGKTTIGVGRNLDDKGLSDGEVRHLLRNDIEECIGHAMDIFPGWLSLPIPAQRVIVNMLFQLGVAGFKKFKRFIRAVEDGHWHRAAAEALDSRAARQTPRRFHRHAEALRTLSHEGAGLKVKQGESVS